MSGRIRLFHRRRGWSWTFVVAIIGAVSGAVIAPNAGAQSKAGERLPIQIDDLYAQEQHAAAALAPSNTHVAFVRQWIDRPTKEERHSLWIADRDTQRAVPREAGEPDARSPVFSPDGKWIVFRSTRSRDGDAPPIPRTPPESEVATDLWLINTSGHDAALPLIAGPRPYGRVFGDPFYGRVAFSPNGRQLVFVADDGVDPRSPEETAADVVVVRPDQGEGYTGYGPASIWVADLDQEQTPRRQAAQRVRRLTQSDAWYGDPQWTPDGKSLIVHANRSTDRESVRFSINKNYDLWQIEVATGELRQLTFGVGPEVSPRVAPSGKHVVCLSSPRKGPHADVFNFAVVSLDSNPPTTRILFDHHGPAHARPTASATTSPSPSASAPPPSPHAYPGFPLPDPCWDDDDHLLYTANEGTETRTARLTVSTGAGVSLSAATPAAKESRLWQEQATRAKLVPAAPSILAQRVLGQTKVVRWKGSDQRELEGVLTTPPAGAGQAPYKLLVYPHGGPHSRSTAGFNLTVEVFAAQGYAVFQPNFRGSQGYGREFLDADRGDFGGGDMRDILLGIDLLIEQGVADRQRQFVYGISYGGYMTTWLVGHTKQFRAAAAQNAVTDLGMMWGLSDIQSWIEWEFGDKPWRIAETLRARSPLSFIGQISTPTLILHSRDDRRCPLPMGLAFYRSLERQGVATQMVIYPNEGHGIRQPKHREDVLRRVLAWFEQHAPPASPPK